jgi:hypothetical protein
MGKGNDFLLREPEKSRAYSGELTLNLDIIS